MKKSDFLSQIALTLATAGMLGTGIPALTAQEPTDTPSALTPGQTADVTEPPPAGETLPLIVSDMLKALWEKGGATDFSDAAWAERIGMSLDRWDGVSGDHVADLTGSDAFYGAATDKKRVENTQISVQEADGFTDHTNGLRMRGLLVIPTDGEYSFAIASDDSSELWLGAPGGSRFTKKKVLSCPSWVGENDWGRHTTAPKTYKAGDVIWLEGLG